MNLLTFAKCLGILTVTGLLTACSGDHQAAPASSDTPVTAVIGSAGGTLTGPDGVQVVVPAGALDQPTTIGIARSSAGAPAALPEGTPPGWGIYEFTPHGLVFNTPVTIRLPLTPSSAGSEVFMADLGGGWQVNGATVVGGYSEWARNSFSWGMGSACSIPANNTDPYWCSSPSGYASASATPASALSPRHGPPGFGSGSWTVTAPGAVQLTLNYFAAPNCGNALVTLIRWNAAVPQNTPGNVQTLIDNQPVALTPTPNVTAPGGGIASTGGTPSLRGVGSTVVNVSSYLTDATNVFDFTFSCQRPGGPVHSGGDIIVIRGPMPAPSGISVSPITTTAMGCSGPAVTFTASGGTPPYTWSSNEVVTPNPIQVTSTTTASWRDGHDNFCGMGNNGTVTITVTDSVGAAASAIITVKGG